MARVKNCCCGTPVYSKTEFCDSAGTDVVDVCHNGGCTKCGRILRNPSSTGSGQELREGPRSDPPVSGGRASVQLVVDCDPGIDDSIALAYLAGEQRAGRVGVAEVTAVRGNLHVAQTGRNAAFMLDRLGLEHVPVHRGASESLTPLGLELDATAFHGIDGMGGLYDPSHPDRSVSVSPKAVRDLLATSASEDGIVLAVGPLTNVALAFRHDPTLARSIRNLVVMGGAFGSPGGNITPRAEYNFHLDGLAAAEVMASGATITLIPLDATHRVLIRERDLGHISATSNGQFVRRLLEASIEIHARQMGLDGCIMHDAFAAAVAVDSTLVECNRGNVRVVADGAELGHSDFEPDLDGTVDVAVGVDADRARAQILDSLARL